MGNKRKSTAVEKLRSKLHRDAPRAYMPMVPSAAMIEAGAQRLVRWETGKEKWPKSWDVLQVSAARNEAERVWRSMWLEYRYPGVSK